MAGMTSMDAKYLHETVGEAVAKGCAAVVVAQPLDPVEYLGHWLKKYVENAQIEKDVAVEKAERLAGEKTAEAAELAASQEVAKELAKRKEALQALRAINTEPWDLWNAAVTACLKNTGAANVYVANLAEDEPKPPKPRKVRREGDEGEEEEEEEAEEEAEPEPEEEEEEEEGDDEEGAKKKVRPRKGFEKMHLDYEAATEGNSWMVGKELRRGTGVTMELVDRAIPLVEVPNALYREGMHFFKGVPRLGGYLAAAISLAPKQYVGFLCADTLKTSQGGSGRPFTAEDREFIQEVAGIISTYLARTAAEAEALIKSESFQKLLVDVKAEVVAFNPELKALGVKVKEEKEEDEEGEDADPDGVKAQLKANEKKLKKLEAARDKWKAILDVHAKRLAAVAKGLYSIKANAINNLKQLTRSPKNTFAVIKAVFLLADVEYAKYSTWKLARRLLDESFFQRLTSWDPETMLGDDKWADVKHYTAKIDKKVLESETMVGHLLNQWLAIAKETSDANRKHKAAVDAANAKKLEMEQIAREVAEAAERARIEAAEAAAAAEAEARAEAEAAAREAEENAEGEEEEEEEED
eukprot:jgi/Mesvir1/24406/Mv11073-RA.1